MRLIKNLLNVAPRLWGFAERLSLNVRKNIFYNVGIRTGSHDHKGFIIVPHVFTKRRSCYEGYFVADSYLLRSEIRINLRRNSEDICRDGWKSKKFNPNGFQDRTLLVCNSSI